MASEKILNVYPVVIAGGSGSRLWPLSREDYPKQFLTLGDSTKSLLQRSVARLYSESFQSPVIVCSERHRFLVAEQLSQIHVTDCSILLEPVRKDTAPAIAAAAHKIFETDRDGVMVVLPADHLITEDVAFRETIDKAIEAAQLDQLVTIGIVPTCAATGFGYIKKVKEKTAESDLRYHQVSHFLEKPSREVAEQLIQDNEYLWNSGIFVFKASNYLSELKKFEKDLYHYSRESFSNATVDLDFIRLEAESFSKCKSISIDFAVMEKAANIAVVPADFSWSDVGSWDSVAESASSDADGNILNGDVVQQDCSNVYVHSTSRLVALKGLRDVSVVETPDAVLVIDTGSAQKIKELVGELNAMGRVELESHQTCYRPWGSYTILASGSRFQVKSIMVKPGARLSLQKHYHRSEHWVVVTGTAVVTIDEIETQLSENESTYIPLGAVHRLFNPGKIPLEIIEVQSGSYLGEDDIVRIGDEYGRTGPQNSFV